MRGWFHVLIQPKWGYGELIKFKQVTPTSLAQSVWNIKFLGWFDLSCVQMSRKKLIWFSSFYLDPESSKTNQTCQQISVKGAVSENVFDHLEAISSSMDIFLIFSGHSDTGLHKPVREFEIWLNLSQGGGCPKFWVTLWSNHTNLDIISVCIKGCLGQLFPVTY